MNHFSSIDRAILSRIQGDLPDTLTPYADLAESAGTTEAYLLDRIRSLQAAGVIRRFGASIKHQRAGWKANVMVAWKAGEEESDALGALAAAHARVSHCYYRPSSAPDWPYTFFTMIHGHSREECLRTVEELRQAGLPQEYAMLESLQELKKISMTYFPDEEANRVERARAEQGE